ncbi:MAG: hypothetical protein IKU22_07330, partial [Alistipes sp.]|nr:hypothetical protein [Alistipes sp.]
RCVGGGLKNGDLLTLKSAYASILPTHARRPRKFITVRFWLHLLAAKGGKRIFNSLFAILSFYRLHNKGRLIRIRVFSPPRLGKVCKHSLLSP